MRVLHNTLCFHKVHSGLIFLRTYSSKIRKPVQAKIIKTPVEWSMSSEICDRKSLFIGRACSVTDIEQAKYNLSQLKVDKRVSKASHNITAWRITSSGHEIIQNFDDNGEAPGGEKILKLLTLVNISNVMVVVTRWYGGIQLGNDRFKHINTCAQEALMNGGFMVKKKRAHKKSRK